MIPGEQEYLSFLMGGAAISDRELSDLGVEILQGGGSPFRGLLIPAARVAAYRSLVREKLAPGF